MSERQDRSASRAASPGLAFTGRRALIVGGSGGIGAAVSRALAARGSSVIVHGGSSRERLELSLRGIRPLLAPGAEASGFLQCISRPSELLGLLPALGRLDILAVCFGPFYRASLASTPAEEWERIALLDLALPGALASALLPGMAARGWGRILLFGGTRTDAIRAYSTNAAYAAAKTALAVLAKSLAAEGSKSGIGCILACPGFVDTEYLGEEARAALRERAPRGRLLEPAELADPVVELLAADPCIASGAILNLDCGLDLTMH